MPRNVTPRVDPDTLPEFLRSKAIGAVIAEALDASTDDELSRPGAVTTMIGDAAREIREFHGLPAPEPSGIVRPMRTTDGGLHANTHVNEGG